MQQNIFYFFSVLLLINSLIVIVSRNTVHAALCLVFAFLCATPLWLMADAEFLSLVLVFVYVGAVMTLFLFVVMMLNVEVTAKREGFARYFPFAIIGVACLVGLLLWLMMQSLAHAPAMGPQIFNLTKDHSSNTQILGSVLYTDFAIPFEITGVILVAAIIAAITLALHGPRKRQIQDVSEQLHIKREDRIRIINLPSEKKS